MTREEIERELAIAEQTTEPWSETLLNVAAREGWPKALRELLAERERAERHLVLLEHAHYCPRDANCHVCQQVHKALASAANAAELEHDRRMYDYLRTERDQADLRITDAVDLLTRWDLVYREKRIDIVQLRRDTLSFIAAEREAQRD